MWFVLGQYRSVIRTKIKSILHVKKTLRWRKTFSVSWKAKYIRECKRSNRNENEYLDLNDCQSFSFRRKMSIWKAHILTDFCDAKSWEKIFKKLTIDEKINDFIRTSTEGVRSNRFTFCEAESLLNEGVATPLCNNVRVVNSSHLMSHCIAFSSASNLARLKKRKRSFCRKSVHYKSRDKFRPIKNETDDKKNNNDRWKTDDDPTPDRNQSWKRNRRGNTNEKAPSMANELFFGHLRLLKPQRGVAGIEVELLSMK